ncbi:MAG: DUF1080 domain-containing protein, partial [Bacteroidota bacterium]
MQKLFFLLVLAAFSVTAFSQQTEWEELFNGRNLKEWKKLDGKAEFKVENGEIVGITMTGTPNTFLATKKTYSDFILEYEMKKDVTLNSGVQFRSHSQLPNGKPRVNGYQVECDQHLDRVWVGGIYEEAGRGWLYPMSYNMEATQSFKRGDWNLFRVEAIGNTIRTYVNGVPYANMVDEVSKEGFIALQVHGIGNNKDEAGKEIHWRNIRISTNNLEKAILNPGKAAPEVSYLNNQLTEVEKNLGWKFLWDGKTTEGWRGAKLTDFPQKGWSIEDGVLTVERSEGGESRNGGDIVTVNTYKNFILEVDFRITRGANSGIKYFVDPDLNKGAGSAIGCEFQILDDKNHPDAKNGIAGNRTLGSLYDLITADALLYGQDNNPKRFFGVGKWNRARIEVRGNKVTHYLNGIKIIEYERGTQMWKALVAYSKYKDWPAFGE